MSDRQTSVLVMLYGLLYLGIGMLLHHGGSESWHSLFDSLFDVIGLEETARGSATIFVDVVAGVAYGLVYWYSIGWVRTWLENNVRP